MTEGREKITFATTINQGDAMTEKIQKAFESWMRGSPITQAEHDFAMKNSITSYLSASACAGFHGGFTAGYAAAMAEKEGDKCND